MQTERYRLTRRAWARIWSDEATLMAERETLGYRRARQERALYLPHLPRDAPLLEAGCGMGIRLVDLTGFDYQVIGLDYVEPALRPLKAADPDQTLLAGDIHRLPFHSESFGAYLSFGVLEHFDFGPGPALAEAWRILRPGGVLVVSVPVPSLVRRLVHRRRLRRAASGEHGALLYETAYAREDLEAAVRLAGFEVVASHPIGHSFTLWGLGWPFRASGYYRTTGLAEWLGDRLRDWLPWSMAFGCLTIAHRIPNRVSRRSPDQ
jgi:SAM-dependent methyltransferase